MGRALLPSVVSTLDQQLAPMGKRVCTLCWKVCTSLRAHKCRTTQAPGDRSAAQCQPGTSGSGTPPTGDAVISSPAPPGLGPTLASATPPTGGPRAELDDWSALHEKLKHLRHTFIPAAVQREYRLLIGRLFSNFNRAQGHVRRDLALRTIMAAICVTTRDPFRYEPGRRSPRSRSAAMRRRIRRAADGDIANLVEEADRARQEELQRSPPRKKRVGIHDTHSTSIKKSMRHAKAGEYRRAMRALQETALSSPSDPRVQEGLAKLHPDPCEPVVQSERTALPPSYTATPDMIRDIVSHLSVTSAPGPDGMTAHLLKPVLADADDSDIPDVDALSELTQFVNIMLQGDISPETAKHFCAATLIGIDKPNGGVRPLAIGGLLRRLVAKVAMKCALEEACEYLMPSQIAVGARNGIDAAVHTLRDTVQAHGDSEEYIMVQIDASNAFNTCNRAMMLREVVKHLPGLARWTNASYGIDTPLLLGELIIMSRAGTQQGDPLGMLYFALVLHPLIMKSKALKPQGEAAPLQIWYADDGNIVGKIEDVAAILELLIREGPAHGFTVHPGKTKAWWPTMNAERLRNFPCSLAMSDGQPEEGVVAMGSPLGSDKFCTRVVSEVLENSRDLLDAIATLPNAQIGFHLHRLCATTPRVIHLLRTMPHRLTKGLADQMDSLSRGGFKAINGFEPDDTSWDIATLPIRLGGLGFSLCRHARLPAAAGSLIDSAKLRISMRETATVLPPSTSEAEADRAQEILTEVSTTYDLHPQALVALELQEAGHTQSAIAGLINQKLLTRVIPAVDRADSDSRCLRSLLLGSASPGASAWLTALPTPTSSSIASNPTWRTQLMLRTRHAMMPEGGTCPVCNRREMDSYGYHALACGKEYGTTRRHSAMVNMFRHKVFRLAGLSTSAEVPNLLPGSDDRPADIYHERKDSYGLPTLRTAYDVTVRSAYTQQNLASKVHEGGEAASRGEAEKIKRYDERCKAQTPPITFVPLAFDTTGAAGPETLKTLRSLARQASCHSSLSDADALRIIRAHVSSTLMKYLALQINARSSASQTVGFLPPST